MSTELCIAGICSSPEAWSVWAAWAQTILTVGTFIYAMRYQQAFNKRQMEREDRSSLILEVSRNKEEQILFTAGLLHLRKSRLESIRKIRSALEDEFPSPMERWKAIKFAIADSSHFDNIDTLIKLHPISWALIKSANLVETAKHTPLSKRQPTTNEEADLIIKDTRPLLYELIEGLEESAKSDEDMIEKYSNELFQREHSSLKS